MAHPFNVHSGAPEILTGARVLTAAEVLDHSVFAFDPGGAARNLDLPVASASMAGQVLFIANTADAAEVITIRTAAAATVATPTQNESAIVFCDGADWHGLVGVST